MTTRRAATTLLAAIALAIAACSRDDQTRTGESSTAAGESAEQTGAPRMTSSADGVHIQYRVYGKGEPAVVLVHCWSCDSSYWDAQLDALRGKYTVVTLDLAGHGASGRNRTDWSVGNYGEDVAAVVRQLPNQQVILVGHSMGGPVVLEAAPRIGDRVIGIIGVDTLKTIGQAPIPQAQLEKQLAAFRADFIGHTRQFVAERLFPQDADPQLVSRIAADMSQAPPEVAISSIENLFRMDMNAALSRLQAPIVAINADFGEPTDEARIRKTVPGFRAVILEGVGHFPMMEIPERFNEALLEEIGALTKGAHESHGSHG